MTATITYPAHVAAGHVAPFDGDAHTRCEAEHGNTAAARQARPHLYDSPEVRGSLWERASDLDAYPHRNARGYVLAYRVTSERGGRGAVMPEQFPTFEAATAAMEAEYSPAHRAMFGASVICTKYTTKSGRIVKDSRPR